MANPCKWHFQVGVYQNSNVRSWPKALVPFQGMNDCYPKAVIHVQRGYSRLVSLTANPFDVYQISIETDPIDSLLSIRYRFVFDPIDSRYRFALRQ